MELTTLRQFKAIAEAKHMTRAAELLGVTQPALSAMLKKLEAEVGASLLHRTGRGVDLTEAGREFLRHADQALLAAESGLRAVRQLAGLEAGTIRIGAGATATGYLLPPVVSAIRARHAGLKFYVREAGSTQVAAAVLKGELDLGIITLPESGKIDGVGEAGLTVKPLVNDELRLIVPHRKAGAMLPHTGAASQVMVTPAIAPEGRGLSMRASGKARRQSTKPRATPSANTPIEASATTAHAVAWTIPIFASSGFRWKELDGLPIIAFEAGSAVRTVIDQAAASAGVTLNVVMELRSIEAIKQMVLAGIGVGLVSRFAIGPGTPFGEGVACRTGKLSRTLAIIRKSDRTPSLAVAAFEKQLVQSSRR